MMKDIGTVKFLWHYTLVWAVGTFLIFLLAILVRSSYPLLPVCIPWMHDYLVIIVLSLCFSLVEKFFKHTTLSITNIWFKYFCKLFIGYVVIASIVFLPNRLFSSGGSSKMTATVSDNVIEVFVPSKQAGSWAYYSKIYVEDCDMSFWYYSGKKPQTVGRRCIVEVKKGIFGIRYVYRVDFLID